jgi:hypothetical protein
LILLRCFFVPKDLVLAYLFEVLPKIEKKFENGVLLLIPCIYIFLILISTILKLHITLLP